MQCKHDESMMMTCLHHPHAKCTMMMTCSCNVNTNDIMPPHSYVAQMEVNTGDVMMMWFALFANLVMSHLACASCACVHGTHALYKYGMSKYLSGLVSMQADSNLGKLTTSHFQVLNTQTATENMPNMFPIVYPNENLMYCNENLA